jgi:hypothetical protein
MTHSVLTLSSDYIPHSSQLWLHNGAVSLTDDPRSSIRPASAAKDKKSLMVKKDADTFLHEKAVAAKIQEEATDPDSPHKKVFDPVMTHFDPF